MSKLWRGIGLVGLVAVAAYFAYDYQRASGGAQAPATAANFSGLRILAGSELKDIEFLRERMESAAGVKIRFDYIGTLDMVDRLSGAGTGTGAADAPDLVWAASNKYLSLAAPGKVRATEKIMLSPVVLGVKAGKLRALGWDKAAPTWADVSLAVKQGQLSFAMSNPAASNSGFAAVVGVAAALAGKGDGLTQADIDPAKLREFFAGVKLTAGSSGWLADAYVGAEDRLDDMVNYESVILSLNAANKLREALVPVYPQEGIITADYPLMLINEARRAQYDKLVAFLREEGVQREIMEHSFRRPVNPAVKPLPVFGTRLLVELPFPGQLAVVDAILTSYLDDARPPAHSYFVLDVSGSMGGEQRMDHLKSALGVLGGGDTATLGGRFSRFQLREKANLITFDDKLQEHAEIAFGDRASYPGSVGRFQDFVGHLRPKGGTAIYDALEAAYRRAAADRAAEPGYYYTIVLMTDGENNAGADFKRFSQFYQALAPEVRQIRIFPILFGEGNAGEMKALADLTGGRVFDAKSASLTAVFKDIRGYQ